MRLRHCVRILPLVGALLAAGLVVSPARSVPAPQGQATERVFPNGFRLIVKPAHTLALAAVQLWIGVGSFRETEATSGYAHVIEHLVFRGGGDDRAGDLEQEVEGLGGMLFATTEKDWTVLGATIASPHANHVIQLIGRAVREARFRPQDYRTELGVLGSELDRAASDPVRVVNQLLFRTAFNEHPYRLPAVGSDAILRRLNLTELEEWYRRYYVPSSMALVVVGDVDPDEVAQAVEAAFDTAGDPAPAAPLPEPELAGGESRRQEFETGLTGAYVGLAFPSPAVTQEPEVYAMDLLLMLLEQGDFGRLPAALQGRVSSVRARFETRRQPGLLTIVAVTDAENLQGVEDTLRSEIQRFSVEPLTEAELTTAKRILAGSHALDNETFSGQANTLGYYEAIDSWRFAETYLERVEATTLEQVTEAARGYLDLERAVTIVLKPGGEVAQAFQPAFPPPAQAGKPAPLILREGRP